MAASGSWPGTTNSGELADLYGFAQAKYGVIDLEDAPQRILMMGDSIGAGNFASTQRGFFRLATQQFTQSAVYNFAESDAMLADMHTEFGTIIAPVLSLSDSKNIVLIEGGTNDLHSTTPAAAYARLQTLCADVRAVDPNATIIVSTVTPRSRPAIKRTLMRTTDYLTQFNRTLTWITAAAHGPNVTGTIDADFLWNVAADPVVGPAAAAADFSLYKDGLHPTTAGHMQMAASLAPLMNALCGNLIDISADANLDLYARFDDGQAIDLTEGRGPNLGRYTLPISAVDLADGLHTAVIFVGEASADPEDDDDDDIVVELEPFHWRVGLLMTAAEAAIMDEVLTDVADFDSDGDIDGGDFLTWQRGLGLSGQSNKSTGDANGDGNVNGADAIQRTLANRRQLEAGRPSRAGCAGLASLAMAARARRR
jgi:lysophospholipase L1-like esterase